MREPCYLIHRCVLPHVIDATVRMITCSGKLCDLVQECHVPFLALFAPSLGNHSVDTFDIVAVHAFIYMPLRGMPFRIARLCPGCFACSHCTLFLFVLD